MANYVLYVGIIMCVLAILMKLNVLNFVIARFEAFHKAIRKKPFSVDKKGLSNYYFILFLFVGVMFLIVALVQYIEPANIDTISLVLYILVIVIGLSGMLYMNISNRFIQYE
jgi:membrane protein required for beta-lactamase induction